MAFWTHIKSFIHHLFHTIYSISSPILLIKIKLMFKPFDISTNGKFDKIKIAQTIENELFNVKVIELHDTVIVKCKKRNEMTA